MKLNHLILVICTGILVGFSACKKDPFTEADAIAAQKELITMKYGYELQLKNIEAAIQKAHDDAAIIMKNLDIKGASDLSKQEAAQDIAYMLAYLEREKQWYAWYNTWQNRTQDSINTVNQAKADAAAIAAAYNNLFTVYNSVLRIMDNGKAIAGATIKVLNADGATFYTATSDANGYIYIKNLKLLSSGPLSIVVPNTAKALYPIYYGTPGGTFSNNGTYELSINSYDPSTLKSITGTVYAALNLTNNAREGAGAGILISADAKVLSDNVNSLTGAKDTITLAFPTSTLSSGAYSLSVPATGGALSSYTLTIPKFLTGYQRAYTLVGENPYQALATRSDSVPVVLGTSGNNTANYTWEDAFYASYFMTLPDSDADGGYSATLTDPKGFLPYLLDQMDLGGNNLPTGYSAADSSLPAGTWKIDADGFLLNNGHLAQDLTNDANIMYDLPVTITLDSSAYNYYMAKADGQLGDTDSATTKVGVRWQYLYDLQNNIPTAIWTPTIVVNQSFGNDTLSVGLVDLTGRFLNDEPELLAVVDASTEVDGLGQITEIVLLEDGNHGLFDISSVLDGDGAAVDYNWFTNYGGRLTGEVTISGTVGNDYTRSSYTITSAKTLVNWNYGTLYTGNYFNAVGVAVQGNNYGEQNISGSRNSYITFPAP